MPEFIRSRFGSPGVRAPCQDGWTELAQGTHLILTGKSAAVIRTTDITSNNVWSIGRHGGFLVRSDGSLEISTARPVTAIAHMFLHIALMPIPTPIDIRKIASQACCAVSVAQKPKHPQRSLTMPVDGISSDDPPRQDQPRGRHRRRPSSRDSKESQKGAFECIREVVVKKQPG